MTYTVTSLTKTGPKLEATHAGGVVVIDCSTLTPTVHGVPTQPRDVVAWFDGGHSPCRLDTVESGGVVTAADFTFPA